MSFIDITGQPLDIELLFAKKGADTQIEQPLYQFLPDILQIPGQTSQQLQDDLTTIADTNKFLSTPLSQYFDDAWAVDLVTSNIVPEGRQPRPPKPPKAPTPPPTVRNNFITIVWNQIASAGGETFVIENSTNVPFQGQLEASIVTENSQNMITLRYSIPGMDFNWSYTNLNQPGFDLKFDLQLDVTIDLPVTPGDSIFLSYQLTLLNMNLSNTDLNASFDRILYNAVIGSDLGNGMFNNGSETIDSSSQINASKLQGSIATIPKIGKLAAAQGFTTVTASIPSNFLKIDIAHPVNPAPQAWLTTNPPFPILSTPEISTVAEASAGETIQVSCSWFPVAQSNQLTLVWMDTTQVPPLWSDVTWGPWGGLQQKARYPRNGFGDGLNTYTAKPLTPNTFYSFVVQDEDFFTMTPQSNLVVGFTSTNDIVNFYLVQGIQQTSIGTATLTATNSFVSFFTASLTIPTSQSTGDYTLSAQQLGQNIASTPIHIVGKGDSPIPVITAANEVMAGNPLTITFQGFNAGLVDIYIESPSPPGISLGAATSPGPQQTWEFTVTWPILNVPRQSVLYAQVEDKSQPAASVSITTLSIPG